MRLASAMRAALVLLAIAAPLAAAATPNFIILFAVRPLPLPSTLLSLPRQRAAPVPILTSHAAAGPLPSTLLSLPRQRCARAVLTTR